MADEMTPQQPNLVEQYAQSVNQRKLEAEAQMQKLIDSLNARKNMPFDPTLMRVAGALLAPTKTGSFGESLGYAATAATDEAQKQAQMNAELAKMEFELSQKKAEQQQAADAMKFRMQYFAGKPQAAAAPAAPAASPLTTAPPIEAKQLTAAPQMSTPRAPALLPEDMPKAPPAPAAPTTYTPRFSASDLAVLGVVDQPSFDIALKLEEQQRKAAELAAQQEQAAAKALEQELAENSFTLPDGTKVPFRKAQADEIVAAVKRNDISLLDEIFRNKGQENPFILKDGSVRRIPKEEWTRKQEAAKTFTLVKRTIPVDGKLKDFEMTVEEADALDKAKQAGRAQFKSAIDKFLDRTPEPSEVGAKPEVGAAKQSTISKPTEYESLGEREVRKVGETKTVEANVAAQAKKSEELAAAVESSGERYQSASTILSLINDDKFSGAQGYFAQPGFKNAFVNFLKDGIRLGNYSLGVPALADALQQVGMTEDEANAKATILQRSGELRMQLAAMLKGSVSNFEQVLLGNISGSVDTPLTSMRAAMSTIQAKAIFDEKNQKAFEAWREKNPYASPGKYTASDEYKSVRKGYLDQVVKINNFYFPKSKVNVSSPAAGAKPEPSGSKPKSSWLPQ
jgi:PIN domain nuclease of toxin-antitoxin system